MSADLFSNGSTPAINPEDAEIPKHRTTKQAELGLQIVDQRPKASEIID